MSRWSLPCCPPSGQVLDNLCYQRCRNTGGLPPTCRNACMVSCSDAKVTQSCCPANVPKGCPNPDKNNYFPDSNPGNLSGPGGAIGGTFNGRQYCCAYSSNGVTPCNSPSGAFGVCNDGYFSQGGGYPNSEGLDFSFKNV